jgi:hypothetical protein
MKQTAVEWLAEQMLWNEFHNPYLEQAKEMEKHQTDDAYNKGFNQGYRNLNRNND